MLRNLLRDNTRIVDRIGEENIEYFITWLIKQKNPDYLDFLSVLCVCEGKGMPRNQTMIMKKLLAAEAKQSILISSKYADGILQVRDRGSTVWVPATEFLSNDVVRHLSFLFFPHWGAHTHCSHP